MQNNFQFKITSTNNPSIKELLALTEKSKLRRESKLVVIEGIRELQMAYDNQFLIHKLYYNPLLTDISLLPNCPDAEYITVNQHVFDKIAYRGGVPNVVAVAEPKDLTFSSLNLSPNPLFLVLETIEKPGNLGAMLRTANAAKVDAVVLCDSATDVWNPNCIRASLGAVFGTPTIVTSSEDAIQFFKSNAIPIYVTWLEASEPYYNCPLDKSAALVMGTEAFGISDKWLDNADKRLIIPMYGEVDSLNVSNSAAIVLFEALRQRVK